MRILASTRLILILPTILLVFLVAWISIRGSVASKGSGEHSPRSEGKDAQPTEKPPTDMSGRYVYFDALRKKTLKAPISQKEAKDALIKMFSAGATESDRREADNLMNKEFLSAEEGPWPYMIGGWHVDLDKKQFYKASGGPKHVIEFCGFFYNEGDIWKAEVMICGIGH